MMGKRKSVGVKYQDSCCTALKDFGVRHLLDAEHSILDLERPGKIIK